jgi:S1-C subfamily serine protease
MLARAGLCVGDVITRIAGMRVVDGDDLVASLGNRPRGEIELAFRRNGVNQTARFAFK